MKRSPRSFIILLSLSLLVMQLASAQDSPPEELPVIHLTAEGWSDPNVGSWNQATQTGTLEINVNQPIQIDANGVTLDGNGKAITGSGTGNGVLLDGRTGVIIKSLNVQEFLYGIYLVGSSNNILSGNTASSNSFGIVLDFSSNSNNVTENAASDNQYGIVLATGSENNTLAGNIASNNSFGIALWSSSNQIYNNNFIGNTTQVSDYSSGNVFSLPAPTGGNYWSNWTDPDANFDGFVDSAYVFTGGQDNLPWVLQDGWEIGGTPPGPEVVVDPVDPITGESPVNMTFDQVDTAGTTTLSISQQGQPPPSGLKLGNPPTYYEINTTAEFSGTVTLCFDYSGIQFGNESNLKLMHYEDGEWEDRTCSLDTENDIICATVAVLSSFAIFEPANMPPIVNIDQTSVTVDEGQTAENTGTVSDPDGDPVTLSASVGIAGNNGDGTWSWSFTTSDGPAESRTVTIYADDGNGGTGQASFDLTINNVPPTVESISVPLDPVNIDDQPVSASATFSDPAGTNDVTYTCTFNYGDVTGDQAGSVSDMTCTGPDHTYTMPGVYTVSVTVTDKDGDSDSATHAGFIVIYDPEDGFVTGGGWINSPEGAYIADSNLTGKANFGFVSKYKKGADTPTGNTEFNFRMADLNFRSTSYNWLVIAGANAKYKGTGSISNEGEYGFMLTATDGYINGGADKFRIKIWDKATEELVYDNKQGEDDDSYEAQEIDGGSIVIHKDGVASAPAKPKPGEFTLLQNYPNSFNPDTWIPYHLAQDVNVTIRIHSVSGELIKTLDLGHRPAGFYITKDKAAYWDGKNEAGEQVASGIYFYTIQAGEFAATKKMVIAQ